MLYQKKFFFYPTEFLWFLNIFTVYFSDYIFNSVFYAIYFASISAKFQLITATKTLFSLFLKLKISRNISIERVIKKFDRNISSPEIHGPSFETGKSTESVEHMWPIWNTIKTINFSACILLPLDKVLRNKW